MLRFKFDTSNLSVILSILKSSSSTFSIIKVNKTITTRAVVIIYRNFARDDLTKWLERFFKSLRKNSLGDIFYEECLFLHVGLIGTELVTWIWQCSAWFAFECEVAKFLTNLLVFAKVKNLNDCSAEKFFWFTAKYGHKL